MNRNRGWLVSAGLALALPLAGCTGPSENLEVPPVRAAQSGEAQTISAGSAKVVTFTDDQSLQYDTGPMDADAPTEFQVTDSGVRYRVLRKSDGPKPTASSSVTVHYRGWLDSGREFDSSYKRGEPITFPLNGVIPGWTEGMQLVGQGGMIELWIPARLGYGAQGSPPAVPPNATLHFVVELLEIQ